MPDFSLPWADDPSPLLKKIFRRALAVAAEWLTLAAIAAVPLIFLTNTSQPLEFPKQIALAALIGVAALCRAGSMLLDRSFVLRRSPANAAVLLLAAVVFISAALSHGKYASVVGDGGQEAQSALATVFFAVLYFIIANIPDLRRFAPRALFTFIVAGGLSALLGILQFAGIQMIKTPAASFNLIGSPVVLGLFCAVTVVMAAAYFLIDQKGWLVVLNRLAAAVFGICALAIVAIINFWPVWAALMIGLGAIFSYAVICPHTIRRANWLAAPMLVFVVSILIFSFNIRLPINAPVEVYPSFGRSFAVARDTLFKDPLFGSGPGTFAQDFALYRAVDLNKNSFWYVQFDHGDSYLTTVAATLGLLGLIAWIGMIAIGIWKMIAGLKAIKNPENGDRLLALIAGAAWLASAAGLVLYGVSFASLFLFWALFGLLVRATSTEGANNGNSSASRSDILGTFVFVALVVISLTGWFVLSARFYADIAFAKGMNENTATQIDSVVSDLENAAQINPQSDLIARNLSQAYLFKIKQALGDKRSSAAARSEKVQTLVASAIAAGRTATSLSPDNSLDWSQLGATYEAIMPYVSNASDEAIKAYARAAELDPTSPVHPTALTRVYLAVAAKIAADNANAKDSAAKAEAHDSVASALSRALAAADKALANKPDYAQAGYQQALVYGAQGRINDAIDLLSGVAAKNPNDLGVGFEMAVLYYDNGQKDKATVELQRIIALAPDYANAHWMLSIIYEEQKQWDQAIAQVQAVLKNDPNNQTATKRLQTLNDEKASDAAALAKPETPLTLP